MSKFKITTDIFTIPYKSELSVLYAPLKGFACVANRDLVNFLSDLENIKNENINSDQKNILTFLIEKGVVNGSSSHKPSCKSSNELHPDKLTLFPTNKCNLACRYCYATTEHNNAKTMDWDIATNSIDYYIDYLKKEQKPLFQLELHGGGEPFFAWSLVQSIIHYAEERCLHEGLKFEAFSSTNGMLNKKQLGWVVQHFKSISVSFDGLPRVQNFQRPTPNNTGSFDNVDHTLKYFDEMNFPYGIRCSVSSFNEDLLDETVEFVTKNYKTNLLYLEPVYICGGCFSDITSLKPDIYKFATNYKRLEPICAQKGLKLEYSGAQFEKISPTFCYVGTDNFAVTPDGYLTNCWEVSSNNHPLADTFIFGRMKKGGQLEFDKEKREYLHSLSVKNLKYCQECFAKWHCAGDCVTRLGHHQFDGPRGGDRCKTNREIIAHRIIQMIERQNYYQPE